MKSHKRPQGLLYGTLILTASNIFVKGLGFAYRVGLARLLGAEGMGLVEMVTPIYSLLQVLAGLGVQTALTQSVAAGSKQQGKLSFRAGRRLLFASGLAVTLLAALCAPLLVRCFSSDQRILFSLQMLLPALFTVSVAAAWRGWFLGRQQLGVLGMSQNLEQLVRVVIGFGLLRRLTALPLHLKAGAVSAATVGGELAGLLYLQAARWWQERTPRHQIAVPEPSYSKRELRQAGAELLRYGLPLTGSRLIASALLTAQAFLIPHLLQRCGYSVTAATEIFGRFSGVALTLLHLPGVFASALSTAVMPAVADGGGTQEVQRRRVLLALQATLDLTLPGMAVLLLYAQPLCRDLFDNAPAAPILQILCFGGPFLYLQGTLAGVLQGLGQVRRLLTNNLISSLLLLIGAALLIPAPGLGIYGAAAAADLAWLGGFLLHLIAVRQELGGLPWRQIAGRPLLATAAACLVWQTVRDCCEQLCPRLAPWLCLAAAGVAYALILLPARRRSYGWRGKKSFT